ncbi:MAG: OprO/OprP family phosphate-selective porin [Flavobacteriaceae bacterium]|jgi:hypothetical protein|nr:OprO/OprP family phosphate-selective porin [Flavobacteriaceae bacterium]
MKKNLLLLFVCANYFALYAQQPENKTILDVLQNESPPKKDTTISTRKLNVYLDSKYENLTRLREYDPNESKFRVVQSRVYAKGVFSDKVTYQLRYRLNESVASNALEFAFLEYSPNENWTFGLGKQFTAWGSMELSYNSADLYMFTNIISSIELFSPGASIAYKTHGHSFKLQAISPTTQFASEEFKNKAYAGLFLWEGKLLQDHLQVRYGYGLFQHDANKFYSWVTLGNRLTVGNWMAELDWIYGSRNIADTQFPTIDNKQPTSYVRDNVTTLSLKYKLDKMTPYVKAMYNYRIDLNTNNSYSSTGISAAVEYNPFDTELMKQLRIYAAYNYIHYDYKNYGTINKQAENQIAIGARWMIPLF